MTVKNKPYSTLPYAIDDSVGEVCVVGANGEPVANISETTVSPGFYLAEVEDANYLSHAANAYPRLVDALQKCGQIGGVSMAKKLLAELGEEVDAG